MQILSFLNLGLEFIHFKMINKTLIEIESTSDNNCNSKVFRIILERPSNDCKINSPRHSTSKRAGLVKFYVYPKQLQNLAPHHGDLFAKIRSFLIIGKFLGIIPFAGVFQKSYLHLSSKICSFSSMISIGVTLMLTLNLILETFQTFKVTKGNAVELAVAIKAPIFYGYGLFIYLYFLLRGQKIVELFHYWAKTHTFYSLPDLSLSRHTKIVTAIILTSAILENAVLHLKYFQTFDNLNDVVLLGYNEQLGGRDEQSSFLEIYYRRSHYDWTSVLGYNEIYAVLVFIANKLTLYSWNYNDLFLCVCGRALYFRFKALYEESKRKVIAQSNSTFFTMDHAKKAGDRNKDWLQIVKDHNSLCHLLKEFEAVLSPLIFLSYVTNIFYFCMQVYMGLHSEDSGPESLIHSIYAPWSLIHLGLRTYLMSVSLARVNFYAHKIMQVIMECPVEYYDKNISRFYRRVTSGRTIGFSGLGCFIVSKPFILKVIGVIFTFEIVLLQGSPTQGGKSTCCCTT